MKAIALMVFVLLFLTSALAHADHLAGQAIMVEQQDCHICNQGLDTPPELTQIQAIVITGYKVLISKKTTTKFAFSYFFQPPLRAPPFIQ